MAGVVAGRVTGRIQRYAIEPRGNGRITLGLSNSDFWQTHEGDREREQAQRLAPIAARDTVADLSSSATLNAPSAPLSAPATNPDANALPRPESVGWDTDCAGPVPEGFHVIDVLQLYTEGLLGRYFGNLATLRPVLRETLDDANQALRNSGVSNFVFAPRGPELLPNSPVPDLFDFDTNPIVEVRDRAAGITDVGPPAYFTFNESAYVPTRRNAMWADVVAVARDGTLEAGLPPGFFTCGVAYVNNVAVGNNGYPTEPGGVDAWRFGYLVYDPGCNVDRLNLAHELGHLVGMDHDPANATGSGDFMSSPWSWGHRRGYGDPRFTFRTVMSSPDRGQSAVGIPYCDNKDNCPQIDAYSTPSLEWAGNPGSGGSPPFGLQPVGTVFGALPIGVPTPPTPWLRPANGADTISRVAPTVAAYRPRPDDIYAHGFDFP